ncbi:MAG: sensor histidine kinase [Rhodocyclaceae bacterium]|nr:sensor histidine kinase [Rhodocyclaceae bacterium]
MNPLMQRLFHTVRDGLFIISRQGHVRFANEAALRLIPSRLGEPINNNQIARMVGGATAGHLSVPHIERIQLGEECLVADADTIQAHLLASPVGTDFVVVLYNLTEDQFFTAAIENLAQLVERECRVPMDQLDEALGELVASVDDADEQRRIGSVRGRVAALGQQLAEQLGRLSALATLSHGHAICANDRIVVRDWLAAECHRLRAVAMERNVTLLPLAGDDLPPLYGSERWLGRALHEALDNALKYAPSRSEIAVKAVHLNGFLRITVRNGGAGVMAPALRQRLMQPLYRGRNARERKEQGFGIGLPVARQIIALHGGRMQIEQQVENDFTCVIELPAGAPSPAEGQLDLEQAKRYARDLARLMERRRTAAAVTGSTS